MPDNTGITRLGPGGVPRPALDTEAPAASLGGRKQVQERVYQMLIADAQLLALTGGAAGDLRVYQAFNLAERVITRTKPAFVALYDHSMETPFLDRESFVFQISMYSRSRNRCRNIQTRIDAVLHRAALGAEGWSDVSMERTATRSAHDETLGVWQVDADLTARVYAA